MCGTITIEIMLKQKYDFDMIRSIFIMDIAIVLSGLIVIGPLHVMYTIVNLFVGKKASDLVMEGLDPRKAVSIISRSEEHTSELQSRGHLVCRLLLEKKNKKSKKNS